MMKLTNIKAYLVDKCYKQKYDVDYKEIFTLIATYDTIRLIIALVAQNSLFIFQSNVKSAFLHGDLQEQIDSFLNL